MPVEPSQLGFAVVKFHQIYHSESENLSRGSTRTLRDLRDSRDSCCEKAPFVMTPSKTCDVVTLQSAARRCPRLTERKVH